LDSPLPGERHTDITAVCPQYTHPLSPQDTRPAGPPRPRPVPPMGICSAWAPPWPCASASSFPRRMSCCSQMCRREPATSWTTCAPPSPTTATPPAPKA
jgi:hypothetical protein